MFILSLVSYLQHSNDDEFLLLYICYSIFMVLERSLVLFIPWGNKFFGGRGVSLQFLQYRLKKKTTSLTYCITYSTKCSVRVLFSHLVLCVYLVQAYMNKNCLQLFQLHLLLSEFSSNIVRLTREVCRTKYTERKKENHIDWQIIYQTHMCFTLCVRTYSSKLNDINSYPDHELWQPHLEQWSVVFSFDDIALIKCQTGVNNS